MLLHIMRRAAMALAALGGMVCTPFVQAQQAEAPAAVLVVDPAAPTVDPPPSAMAVSPAPQLDHLPAGTIIEIRIDEPVNSKTHETGDWYGISLARPIMLGDTVLIPAGTPGRGQVVHAAKSSWGGKAGELILGARYLEFEGRQIALRGMKLGGVGGHNEGLAFATSVAGGVVAMPLVFAINGKNADIPVGTLATAKLAAELRPPVIAVAPADASTPAIEAPPVAGPDPQVGTAPGATSEVIKSVPTKEEDI
ncbi:hypothetical protein ATE71_17525 [Sphingopyxis sp. H115]|nr:hypothetical protein ATE71_17525 [Sphingopyxis sp. H115]